MHCVDLLLILQSRACAHIHTILSANNIIKWVKSKIEHPCGWSTHGNALPKMMKYHCCPTWWWYYYGANHILSAVRHWDWTWNFDFQVSSIAFGKLWSSSNQYSPFFSSHGKSHHLWHFFFGLICNMSKCSGNVRQWNGTLKITKVRGQPENATNLFGSFGPESRF